ncbi:MAG: ATP-binding protein [Pseudomonadota bacterium]
MRVFPKSLVGQLAVVIAVALLIAQGVNLFLLLQSRERIAQLQLETIFERFADDVATIEERNLSLKGRLPLRGEHPFRRRLSFLSDTPQANEDNFADKETAILREVLLSAKLPGAEAAFASPLTRPPRGQMRPSSVQERSSRPALVLSLPYGEGQWVNGVYPAPRPNPLRLAPLVVQTVVIYTVLLFAVILLTRRLSAPLIRLTEAAEKVMTPDAPPSLPPEGPADIQALTLAFENMRARIRALFKEKDMMLGAIGHDLRTPLTSLRIRVETIEDERLREKMITSIEELSFMLEDILNLARDGQEGATSTSYPLHTLIQDVVDGFLQDQGRLSCRPLPESVLSGYPLLLRRALQNLIENGLRYGNHVTVSINHSTDYIDIHINDDGPGMSEEEQATLRQAFTRGEASRNKATGGVGLGLALAEKAAEAHGGELLLKMREEGGLRATLRLKSVS